MEVKDLIRIRRLELGLTLNDVAEAVGVRAATVSRWESGDIENMRRDKIEALAKVLGISPLQILGWEPIKETATYYTNPETAEIAQRIYEDKELRALFDAAADADPEDLQAVQAMLKALKRKERGS